MRELEIAKTIEEKNNQLNDLMMEQAKIIEEIREDILDLINLLIDYGYPKEQGDTDTDN